ncbi:hypothetical protein VB618_15395 [Microvirga sp. CF3062]|nr:hypothetical protein [Microvirga sp. CF3062]MEE1657591.1 hypothetical protein [Microvirga sp. CF3062]
MLNILALSMIGQYLDNSTFGDPSVVASDHSLQFITKGGQAGNIVLYLLKMGLGDVVHLATGAAWIARKTQELPDGVDLKAELGHDG